MKATRRGFLMAAGLAALPAGTAPAEDDLAVLGRRLRGLLSGPDPARHVAEVYLAGLGGIGWRDAALDLGMPALLAPASGIVEPDALRTWLGARIREDFAVGAVIGVDGWRLSRTEVGACVLASGVA
jgi:hypothetical protein